MKIYIRRQFSTFNNEIYFVNEPSSPGLPIEFINIKEDGTAIATRKVFDPGAAQQNPPTLILDEYQTRELIQAFVDIAKEEGIEPSSESKAKGKLEATERHLEDLRKLLKLR